MKVYSVIDLRANDGCGPEILGVFTDRTRAENFLIREATKQFELEDIEPNDREVESYNGEIYEIHSKDCYYVDITIQGNELDEDYGEMVEMTVYCDTTGLYTEKEIEQDNLCELMFPRWLVRCYYEEVVSDRYNYDGSECISFESWLEDFSDACDTEYLYDFAKEHGFTATRQK